VTNDELANNSVGYSEYLGSVVLPVFAEDGSLASYQFRPVVRHTSTEKKEGKNATGNGEAPKYISRRQQGRKGGVDIFRARPSWSSDGRHNANPSTVVIVEDVLSAIKVSRVPKNVGVALMGSHLKEEQAVKISQIADNVVVFLDNDNDEVKRSQRKAAKTVGPLVRGDVRIIEAEKDPKDHTNQELRDLLEGLCQRK